ncbi:MAG: class I SAM-dependent methyltransferase [Sporolactobacillus sp.]|uniref:class I SAM-dependent methyltransferase n=1 Tax=Sporolactobacillus sp. STSJ-5 TaxID=2965076 RepID=UPI002106FA19|nr:methyltransferase domain-containing protein [Sporolactobacillus sp. STSJ-5]
MPNHRYIDFLAKLAVDNAHPGGHGLTEAIIEQLSIRKNSSLLDVGCGTGATTVFIAEKLHADVTGIDLHPGMVKRAKARAAVSTSAPKIVLASAEQLPFESNYFDYLLSESVTAFTDVSLSVPEYYRVLKPEGQLAAIEMTVEKQPNEQDKRLIESVYGVSDVRTENEWLSIWKSAGFINLKSFHANEIKTHSGDVLPTYNLTSIIDEGAIEVWLEHMQMMQKFKDVLTYRVFTMSKPSD